MEYSSGGARWRVMAAVMTPKDIHLTLQYFLHQIAEDDTMALNL